MEGVDGTPLARPSRGHRHRPGTRARWEYSYQRAWMFLVFEQTPHVVDESRRDWTDTATATLVSTKLFTVCSHRRRRGRTLSLRESSRHRNGPRPAPPWPCAPGVGLKEASCWGHRRLPRCSGGAPGCVGAARSPRSHHKGGCGGIVRQRERAFSTVWEAPRRSPRASDSPPSPATAPLARRATAATSPRPAGPG
jgi:hypothetical protein